MYLFNFEAPVLAILASCPTQFSHSCYICVRTCLLQGLCWGPGTRHWNGVLIKASKHPTSFSSSPSCLSVHTVQIGARKIPPQITATYFHKSMKKNYPFLATQKVKWGEKMEEQSRPSTIIDSLTVWLFTPLSDVFINILMVKNGISQRE